MLFQMAGLNQLGQCLFHIEIAQAVILKAERIDGICICRRFRPRHDEQNQYLYIQNIPNESVAFHATPPFFFRIIIF